MTTQEGRGPAGCSRRPREARALLVTGMSGAGRSVARKTLEDIGCEAIDNLPLALVPILVAPAADAPAIGLGIDARTRGFGIAAMPETLGAVDLGFDVRFLANPHYIARSRPLCGLDPPVAAHIAEDAEFKPFFDRLWQLLRPLLPRYEQEGKANLTIAIGCTGGRHRSVSLAERLAARLRSDGLPVEVAHRDLPASGPSAPPAAPAPAAAG